MVTSGMGRDSGLFGWDHEKYPSTVPDAASGVTVNVGVPGTLGKSVERENVAVGAKVGVEEAAAISGAAQEARKRTTGKKNFIYLILFSKNF